MKHKKGQDIIEWVKECEAMRLSLQIDAFEFGIISACMAQMMGREITRAHRTELGPMAKQVRKTMKAFADMDGLVVPPKAKRGIGFVVWMIARRRVVAAPPGWLKVMHSTRWEVTESGGRRPVHTTTYICDETAP